MTTTVSLFLQSTTLPSTKTDKLSSSENATPPAVSGISPWHRKQRYCHSLTTQQMVPSKTSKTKQDLAAFLHACAFSPLPSTFLWAIQRGHFSSWLSLTMTLSSPSTYPNHSRPARAASYACNRKTYSQPKLPQTYPYYSHVT